MGLYYNCNVEIWHPHLQLVALLELHKYIIPNYPVQEVDLVHIKVKNDDDTVVDAFMQASRYLGPQRVLPTGSYIIL